MQRFGNRSKTALAVMAGLAGLGLAIFTTRSASKLLRRYLSTSHQRPPWKMTINVARNENQCVTLVDKLKKDIEVYKVLGFDCEWVNIGARHPVALVQLASREGHCGLFQIHYYSSVPSPLKELLEDKTILKVGVDPFQDAKYLFYDYGINVAGTYDIRHLIKTVDKEVRGLASIVYAELDVKLPKNFEVRVSNWEAENLTNEQLDYAANDALASLLAFNKLIEKKVKVPFFSSKEDQWKKIHDYCAPLLDRRFKIRKFIQPPSSPSQTFKLPLDRDKSGQPQATNPTSNGKRSYMSIPYRKTPLYDNAFMLAPDGTILCTCDLKKAEWYVSKGLATIVETEPLKIQLNFQPNVSRTLNGPSAEYYTIAKENRCVVCGRNDSYVRKKIVPHEYRKHFPECMKNHQCHDILLLCAPCHVRSNISDHSLRVELSHQCNAPLASEENVKVSEDKTTKSIRSAARALLNKSHKLPEKRRKELTDMLRNIFQADITPDLLNSLKDVDITIANQSYAPHGLSVVEHFAKEGIRGLMDLEKLWREHFLKAMQPKYLPPLWSVNHYHEHEKDFYFDSEFLDKIKLTTESKSQQL